MLGKKCCFRLGFRIYNIIHFQNNSHIPLDLIVSVATNLNAHSTSFILRRSWLMVCRKKKNWKSRSKSCRKDLLTSRMRQERKQGAGVGAKRRTKSCSKDVLTSIIIQILPKPRVSCKCLWYNTSYFCLDRQSFITRTPICNSIENLYSGLPPGSQKYYRVRNYPKIPIKCQLKIPSFWQINDKNTDTKEGESKQ